MNEHETGLTVIQNPGTPALGPTIWNTPALMQETFKMAQMLSNAGVLPAAYKGDPGACILAIDLAGRMGISPFAVMQWTQVVYGNMTWKGSACKALVDNCGLFRRSEYEFTGTQGKDDWGCRLVAEKVSTGEKVYGPWVTWKLAKDEGWVDRRDKSGAYISKWRTMPELMIRYRAASFFAKTECPEVLMGFQTAEEVADIAPAAVEPEPQEAVFCEDCGQEIKPHKGASVGKITDYSQKHWHMNLCGECVEKRRRKPVDAPEPQGYTTDTTPVGETPQNEAEAVL